MQCIVWILKTGNPKSERLEQKVFWLVKDWDSISRDRSIPSLKVHGLTNKLESFDADENTPVL